MDPNTSTSKGLCENEINPIAHNYCYWACTIYIGCPNQKINNTPLLWNFQLMCNTNKKIIIV